ncbi:MAG: N-acetyl-lysine deacetylase [Minisyncoccus archaeiphilus]|uniref:M20/M25/M40 family metallo-hydrolase n=1 Tax=Minisyncoccus archaeiphilus TaxID=3238481 RepID=UPI002B14AF41|nr:MAG: N-acetyl-lysine deacetylase [Candidatus Parcubacteria bacterium]
MNKEIIDILFGYKTDNSEDVPSDQILPCLQEIKTYLEEKGINAYISEYDVEDRHGKKVRRGNLLSYRPGADKPYILFQGHIDTVPALPHEYVIEGGRLIGRGSVDMKGSLVSMIEAHIETYHNTVGYSSALLITGDEEANGFAGIKHFIKSNDIPIYLVINGEPSSFDIQTKFKGVFIVEVLIRGENKHSSDYDDVSIIEKSLPFLEDVRAFLDGARSVIDDNLGQTVAALTVVSAGNKSNQFPDQMRVSFNARTVKSSDCYLSIYESYFGKYQNREDIDIKVVYFNPVLVELSEDEKQVIKGALSQVDVVYQESVMRAFTEASILNEGGYRTFICGPGDLSLAHVDPMLEVVEMDKLRRYRDFLKYFVRNMGIKKD